MSIVQDRTLTAEVDSLMLLQSRGHRRPRQIRDASCSAKSRVVSAVSVVSDHFRMLKGRCELTGSTPPLQAINGRQPLSDPAAYRGTRDKRDSGTQPAQPDRSTQ
jgi:hypothetical protein